jgi:hypothetical protein
MGAQRLHDDDGAENADDLKKRPRRENLIEQLHVMLRHAGIQYLKFTRKVKGSARH